MTAVFVLFATGGLGGLVYACTLYGSQLWFQILLVAFGGGLAGYMLRVFGPASGRFEQEVVARLLLICTGASLGAELARRAQLDTALTVSCAALGGAVATWATLAVRR